MSEWRLFKVFSLFLKHIKYFCIEVLIVRGNNRTGRYIVLFERVGRVMGREGGGYGEG